MSRPDLSDPVQRSAYRRELRRLYRPWRWGGLALVTAGLVVMLVRGNGFDTPSLILFGVGWVILGGVIVARTRYNLRRMRDL